MLIMKLKTTAAVLLAVAVVALAGGALAHGLGGAAVAQTALTAATPVTRVAQQDPAKKEEPARKEKKDEPKEEPKGPGAIPPGTMEWGERFKAQMEEFRKQMEEFRKQMEEFRKQMGQLPPGMFPQIQLQPGVFPQRGVGRLGGQLEEGRLGVSVRQPDDILVDQLKLTKGQGVVLNEVKADSAAAKAGLQAGDILLEFDAKPVPSNMQDFTKMVQDIKANTSVDGVVLRKGKRETFKGLSLPEAKP